MCTAIRFNDDKNNFFFGRNLDWTTDYGEKVIVTPRNFKYSSAFLGEMTPKAGAIIGMAIIEEGKPLYFDCANEAGLAIAGLNFPGYAKYEEAEVSGKTNVAAYEFPLFITLNFSSVDEAEAALKNTAIVAKPVNEKYPVAPLHYIIADKNRSIVVEYTKNGMEIHHNEVDVLTNQPGFNWHHENLRNHLNLFPNFPPEVKWRNTRMSAFGTGALMQGLPGGYSPADRFVRIAYFHTHYPVKSSESENLTRLFKTLSSVSMIEGGGLADDGKFEVTIYTSGYSSASKTYHFNTYEDQILKSYPLASYNLDQAELIEA
ncbi:MAG: choloylglycine hydrolase [Candidatus Saccharibacteria bacterium]|nr:choloylglycine hydrolase [Candidatus Saccharibacteria bacterium]